MATQAGPKLIQGIQAENDHNLLLIIAKAGGPITRAEVERLAYKQGFQPYHSIRVLHELGYIESPDKERRTLALTDKGAAAYAEFAKPAKPAA